MRPQEIILDLHSRGVLVQADKDELVITGKTDVLTQMDILALRENKAQLIALLSDTAKEPVFTSRIDSDSYVAPAANLQRNIYFLESLAQDQHFYNVPTAFKLTGEVNETALTQAIHTICERFDILRTVYRDGNETLEQVVEPFNADKVPFEVVSVTDEALATALKQQADYGFDLSSHWPIKAVLFKTESVYVLSLNIHHIAIDGYSAKLVTEAVSEAYQYHLGSKSELVSGVFKAPQYADYAYWHQEYLQSEACTEAKGYWQQLLKDAPSCHNFPLEYQRPSGMSVAGDTCYQIVEGALFDKIKAAAKSKNVSVFHLMQSLFAGFLARYADSEDLVIGSVYANRTPSDFINTVGMFANAVPFRYKLSDSTDMGHLIQSTTKQHQKAVRYQQLPFEMMLEGLALERDPSFNPLIQVQFVLQENALDDFSLEGLTVEVMDNRQQVAKFDFAAHLYVNQDNLKIQWEYNTNLFSRQRTQQIIGHWLAFAEHHIDNEFDSVMLYRFKQQQIQAEVSTDNFNQYLSNPELIAGYAQSQGDAIAVVEGDKKLSYSELVALGDKFIAGLQNQGVNFGDRVAVYMDKSIEQVIAMYATMRAGFVYVPLDPSYPEERLAYICQNSQAKALVYASDFEPSETIYKETPLAAFDALISCEAQAQLSAIDAEHPAYIIYTSGSTGKPKGVIVPHGSIYYSLQANRKVYDFNCQDMMPTVGSQAFGVSLLETFVPLVSGGTVQALRKPDVTDIARLIDATQAVSVMHMVPSVMAQWLDLVEAQPNLYPQLRLVLVGAEPVPPVLFERMKAWRSDIIVRVLYGMTESSVVSSSYLSHEHDGNGYSVGKPHPNMRFYCVNQYGVPQPAGVPGELYVGGLSLAQGYVALPELSAEKFIYHKRLQQRLYKTGDRARLTAKGHFEFLGRVDHQVSLRGIRIETGEIESLVNALADIKKCVAHVVALDNGDSKFVLYYSRYGNEDKTEVERQIKAALNKDIPESMRPSVFVELEAFPHNPNGKIDRKKLPKPTGSQQYVAPQSDTQQFLHDVWCSMLELERVSIYDNFFELGGHSLMATKLVNQVNNQYGIAIPLKSFFEASNIHDCAAVIDQALSHQRATDAVLQDDDETLEDMDEFLI